MTDPGLALIEDMGAKGPLVKSMVPPMTQQGGTLGMSRLWRDTLICAIL
jgi:hypothetical protein